MVCVTQHTLNCCNTVMFNVEEERQREKERERGWVDFNCCNTRQIEKIKKE